jgi:hypothetical protein
MHRVTIFRAMVERGARGGGSAAAARAKDRLAARQGARRRLWIVLVGAIVMAVAGALTASGVRLDDLVYPDLRGPRLRISPAGVVKPASLSRERPTKGSPA